MDSAQGTMRLRTGRSLWSAKVLSALVFSITVGVCTYALTYHTLVIVTSTSPVSSVAPDTNPSPTTPAAPVTPEAPAATPTVTH